MFISSGTPAVFKKCSPIMLLTSFGRQVVHHSKASSRYQSRQQQAFKKVFTTRAHLVFFFFYLFTGPDLPNKESRKTNINCRYFTTFNNFVPFSFVLFLTVCQLLAVAPPPHLFHPSLTTNKLAMLPNQTKHSLISHAISTTRFTTLLTRQDGTHLLFVSWSPSNLKVIIRSSNHSTKRVLAWILNRDGRSVLCDEECLRGIAAIAKKTIFRCFRCETDVFVTFGNWNGIKIVFFFVATLCGSLKI